MKTAFHMLPIAAAMLLGSSPAQARLFDRGGGMVYDDGLNITWMQNWNTSGLMNWTSAVDWASNLVVSGLDDWRLPTTNTTPSSNCSFSFDPGGGFPLQFAGVGCTGSEMGHLLYIDLGASLGSSFLAGSNTTNLALFTNMQSANYWTGTAFAPPTPFDRYAWAFGEGGSQGIGLQSSALYAVAVRPGDVSAVPEPEFYVMLLAGLGALAVKFRRRTSCRLYQKSSSRVHQKAH